MDPIALKIQQLIPAPINTQTTSNWDPTIVTATTQQIFSLKFDQNFGYATKMSFFWNKQSTSAAAYADGLPEPLTTVRSSIRLSAEISFV